MFKTLEVLIPTMNLKIEDIEQLLSFWNIQSNCTISNQCGSVGTVVINYNNFKVRVLNIDSKGVSKNRNNLLKHLNSDVGLFIDDDCSLIDGYENIVLNEMNNYNAEAISFNGINDKGSEIIKESKTIRCKKYSDISHIGGPGICVSKRLVLSKKIFFNESLGTPNRIYLGEDSLFGLSLIKSNCRVFKSKQLVFRIMQDIDNSSYFEGYNEQYFYSRGAINKLVHPKTFFFWRIYYSCKLCLKTKKSIVFIIKNMRQGEKAIGKGGCIL